MAVKIRMQRNGRTHRPFYQIVAADSRKPRDGRFIEKLGTYDPSQEPSAIELKEDRIQYWYGRGAQCSNSVKVIMDKKNIKLERLKTQAQPQG